MKSISLSLVAALWLAANHFVVAQTALFGMPSVPNPYTVMNFSPYILSGQNPNAQSEIPEAQSTALLDSLLPFIKGIRTFGTQGGLQFIPKLAKDRGLKVLLGIWIGRDKATNEAQIANAVTIINAGHADTVIVGSEVLLRGDQPADTLVKYIKRLQAICDPKGIPVTCADVYSYLMAYPQVMEASDFVAANIYPWWEQVGIDEAMCRFNKAYECLKVKAKGKPIFISETGWKTANANNGAAIASLPNSISYHIRIRHWSLATGNEVCPFIAFDEPWKGSLDNGWGFFSNNAKIKPGMEAVFQPIAAVDTSSWSCPWPPLLGQPGVFIDHLPVIGSYDFLEGHVTGVRPCLYKIAIYIKVPNWGWVSKPTRDMPFAFIDYSGRWSADYVTGGTDYLATDICAFLVPIDYKVPFVARSSNLPPDIFQNAIASNCYHRYELPQAATVANPDTICYNSSTTLTASGGVHYFWETGDTTAQIKVSPAGSSYYHVTISDGLGGGAILRQYVHVLYFSPTLTADKYQVCKGDSVKLTAAGGVAYCWPSGDTTRTITVTAFRDSVYQVVVKNANGCTQIATVLIRVSQFKAAIWTVDSSVCAGQRVVIYAISGTSFIWSTGQTTAPLVVNPTETTTYSVTITNTLGCKDSTSLTIKIFPKPVASILISPTPVCKGAPVQCSASGGGTYKWNNGKTDSVFVYVPDYTQTLSVTVTNEYYCESIAVASVTVNNRPNAVVSPSSATICPGQTKDLFASGSGSYVWSTGSTANFIRVSPTGTSTYTLTVTNNMGCTNTDSSIVTVTAFNPMVTAAAPQICAGDTTTLFATGGDTYLWSTGETTDSIRVSPNDSQTYSVRITKDGCTQSVSILIVVIRLPNAYATAAPPKICKGDSATLSAYNGTSYVWSTGETTQTILVTPSTTTIYTVTVEDALGCSKVAEVKLPVVDKPDATIVSINGQPILGDTIHVCRKAGPQTLMTLDSTGSWYNIINGKFDPNNYALGSIIQAIHWIWRDGCSDYDTLFIKIDCIDKTIEQDLARYCAVSPNPFQDKLVISATISQAEPITAILFNPLGQVVAASTAYPFAHINGVYEWSGLQHLPEGIYLLTLHVKNNAMATFKVLKR